MRTPNSICQYQGGCEDSITLSSRDITETEATETEKETTGRGCFGSRGAPCHVTAKIIDFFRRATAQSVQFCLIRTSPHERFSTCVGRWYIADVRAVDVVRAAGDGAD